MRRAPLRGRGRTPVDVEAEHAASNRVELNRGSHVGSLWSFDGGPGWFEMRAV